MGNVAVDDTTRYVQWIASCAWGVGIVWGKDNWISDLKI
jgi:hypothetical protein